MFHTAALDIYLLASKIMKNASEHILVYNAFLAMWDRQYRSATG